MQSNYGVFWLNDDFFDECLEIIDQKRLPFEYHTKHLTNTKEVLDAIKELPCDGGVIRSIALFGIFIAALEAEGNYERVLQSAKLIKESRCDITNFEVIIDRALNLLSVSQNIIEDARKQALDLSDDTQIESKKIAEYGCKIIEDISKDSSKEKINILIHSSNMAVFTIIYEAIKRDLDIHIWVEASEGQALWELSKSGINYSVIDESGSLLQNKEIDLVIVGAIGVDECGKTTNRAGTYLKAIGAHENLIPFYVVALELDFGFLYTPKPQEKPFFAKGVDSEGLFREIQTTQDKSKNMSYGFDTTPAKFITGFITPEGIYKKDFDKISKKFN